MNAPHRGEPVYGVRMSKDFMATEESVVVRSRIRGDRISVYAFVMLRPGNIEDRRSSEPRATATSSLPVWPRSKILVYCQF